MGEDEEEFLRDILSKPAFSSESESQAPVVSCSAKSKRAPMAYILSFDNSTITPAPSLFQKAMTKIFEPILENTLVYIDDILLFSKDIASHKKLLNQFFEIAN